MDSSAAPRFRLPSLAWVAAGVCAGAPLLGVVQQAADGRLTPQGAGLATAMAALVCAVPLAVAWGVWHLAGRRAGLRDGAFFVALALTTAALFTHAAREAEAQRTAAEAHARSLANHLVGRRPPDGPGRPAATAPAGVPPDSPVGRAVLAAEKAVRARLDAVQQAYDDAFARLTREPFFALERLATPEAIAERRQAVTAFEAANRLLHETASLTAFQFSVELRDRGVPEEAVREAIDVYRGATKKHLPRLKQLRDHDSALALQMRQLLDFATARLGQWQHDPASGRITFTDSAAHDAYEHLLRTAEILEAQRARGLGERRP